MRIARSCIVVGLTATAVPCALAGDLTPPPGPVAPTFKTLHEVEPRRPLDRSMVPITINQSGSYYLTENLFPAAIGDPFLIEILADDVSLDLRGFTVFASTEVTVAMAGIQISATDNVEVFDGSVVGADGFGIVSSFATSCLIRHVRVRECSGTGISVGQGSVLEGCVALDNGLLGFNCGGGSAIIGCTAEGNSSDGFVCPPGSTISACAASNNGGDGFSLGDSSRAAGCSAEMNGADGFVSSGRCQLDSCLATGNGGSGFRNIGSGATWRDCYAGDNGDAGFRFSSNCSVIGCEAIDNDSSGGGTPAILSVNGDCLIADTVVNGSPSADGIDAGDGGHVTGCTVTGCGGHGIIVDTDGMVERCVSRNNGGDGIRATWGNLVAWNSCSDNGGAGIHATFQVNRIDSNLCRSNGSGIQTSSTANLIVRNSCVVNGINYDLNGGDKLGPIGANPALAGPWDNFD